MDFSKILTMDTNTLELLNKAVVREINSRYRAKQVAAAGAFNVGQVVEFDGKYGQTVFMRLNGINAKTLAGTACQKDGTPIPGGTKWRVSPTLCKEIATAKA